MMITHMHTITKTAGSTNDFTFQMCDDQLGLSKKEFTVVALDLPGYGRSDELSEQHEFTSNPTREYFEFCVGICSKLMQQLEHKTYSVGGWNDGARVACLLAIRWQSRVNALVLWGFVPLIDKQSSHAIARTRDTSIWDPQMLQSYSEVYGEQRFSDLWHKYVDFIVATLEIPERQFDLRAELCQIKCPTLVLHGSNDPIVSYREHVKPLEMQIYDSDIKQFKAMSHNIHQADPSQFNQVFTTFVTSLRA